MRRVRLARQAAGLGAVDVAARLLGRVPAAGRLRGRHATVVMRLSAADARALAAAAAPLRAADPAQLHPAASALHVTVCGPPLAADGSPDLAAVRALAARHAPFGVRLSGVRLGPGTVLVRALAPGGELAALRRDLRRGLSPARRLRAAARDAALGGAGHVTLARLRTAPAPALAPAVRELRGLDAGTVKLDALEVVLADRVLSEAGSEVLARVPLGPDRGRERVRGAGRKLHPAPLEDAP